MLAVYTAGSNTWYLFILLCSFFY